MKFGTGIAVRNAIFRIERVFPRYLLKDLRY